MHLCEGFFLCTDTGMASTTGLDKYLLHFAMVLFVCLTAVSGGACPSTLFPNCTCAEGKGVLLSHLKCLNAGLTSYPGDLPPATDIRIENNLIDVVESIPYEDPVLYLYLIGNGIRLVRDGAFQKLSKLERLSLSNNEITSIRRLTFDGLENLEVLVLSGNPIYHLRTGTFDGAILPQLNMLYLDQCKLYQMDDMALDTMKNLRTLVMTRNYLKSIPILGCTGHSLDNLNTWDLSSNQISESRKSDCRIPNLNHLYLTRNRLEFLNASFMGTSIANVVNLHLGHNDISHVSELAFRQCVNLTYIDLTYNQLRVMEKSTISWEKVEAVYIHDNPWDCSCTTRWLIDEIPVAKYNSEFAVRCATPEKWHNVSVTKVDQDLFNCQPPDGHVVGIVIGVICGVIGLFICLVVFYRLATRRRPPRNQGVAIVSASPKRSTSPTYRRMDNDVTFEYSNSQKT